LAFAGEHRSLPSRTDGSLPALNYIARMMRLNPAREVRKIRYATSGFHTWTRAEVRQFEDHHSIGTKPRLALALLLYLGVRRGDAVTLDRQHVKDNWLCFVPRKTRYRRRRMSEKLILPPLADIIERSPTGDLTFLVTEFGRAFTAAGFGNWFRKQCDDAGLPQCSAHGLRRLAPQLPQRPARRIAN
jgi:integrase